MTTRLEEIREQASTDVTRATTLGELEQLRVHYLGRKAEIPQILRGVASLSPEEKAATGKLANIVRKELTDAIDDRKLELERAELEHKLRSEVIDTTLPGVVDQRIGQLHLLTATRRAIEDFFLGFGFQILEGPEIETTANNFDALNHHPMHPARAETDTFYISDDLVLRTHTSPVQIRTMCTQPPPLYVIACGRVFRPDSDATHTPQFHQIEGLAVDEDVTLGDLQGLLLEFAKAMFGDERDIRLRPHYFPFTEPSVEIDVSCFQCNKGTLRDGSRCGLCKGTAWIEVLGAGMVDPNVFSAVREHGYDPEKIQGFAWGMGIDRIAMLRHGVTDLRLLFDNDVRFLEQFA